MSADELMGGPETITASMPSSLPSVNTLPFLADPRATRQRLPHDLLAALDGAVNAACLMAAPPASAFTRLGGD